MLKWFVSSTDAERVLRNNTLLEEDSVETRPEKVPSCCIDENVNVFHIKKYFTTDAWKVVFQILDIKRNQDEWFCVVCDKGLEDTVAIACDCCLQWFHLICVGLRNAPKRKKWFCRFCYEALI